MDFKSELEEIQRGLQRQVISRRPSEDEKRPNRFYKKCFRCGRAKCDSPDECPAKNSSCRRCGLSGHWQSTCSNQVNELKCFRCGRAKCHSPEECPARTSSCRRCGRRGHWKSTCRKQVNELQEEAEPFNEEYWRELSLISDGGEDLIKGHEQSLKALSLYAILQFAIDTATVEIFKKCFKLGININSEVKPGKTPLLLCIDADNKALVKAMIECGVDVNYRTKDIDSPLHYAVDHGKANAAEALLEYGKDKILVNSLGLDGLAPMHRAAKYNRQELILILARHGADVNVKGEGGATPLHVSAACNVCAEPSQKDNACDLGNNMDGIKQTQNI